MGRYSQVILQIQLTNAMTITHGVAGSQRQSFK